MLGASDDSVEIRLAQIERRLSVLEAALVDPEAGDSSEATLDNIIRVAAFLFETPSRVICGDARTHEIVRARFAIYYVAREVRGISYERIGRAMGRRDHTTVRAGWIRTPQLMESEPEFRRNVTKMLSLFMKEDTQCPQQ